MLRFWDEDWNEKWYSKDYDICHFLSYVKAWSLSKLNFEDKLLIRDFAVETKRIGR